MSGATEFYRNGRCRVEAEYESGGIVRFRIYEGGDWWSGESVVGHAWGFARWWKPWTWRNRSVPAAARLASRIADDIEREYRDDQQLEDHARKLVATLRQPPDSGSTEPCEPSGTEATPAVASD